MSFCAPDRANDLHLSGAFLSFNYPAQPRTNQNPQDENGKKLAFDGRNHVGYQTRIRAPGSFLVPGKDQPAEFAPSLVRSLKKTLMDACTDLIHGDPANPHKPASMSIRVLLSEPRLEPAGVDDNWGFFNVERVYDGSGRADSTRQISEFYLYLNHPSQPDQT